jgi:NADH-quinone oxidoreductase subunit H
MIEMIIIKVICALIVVGVIMFVAAYSVLIERKVSSWIQGRLGPNRTSLPLIGSIPVIGKFLTRLGVFQPLADGLKFLFKEDPIPGSVSKFHYVLAPVLSLVPALTTCVVVPFGMYVNDLGESIPLVLANIDISTLFVLAISSLGVYGVVIGGWASNNKYSFMGSIRASAQMISYELSLGMAILPVLLWMNAPGTDAGLSLANVVKAQEGLWFAIWQPLSALIFLVAMFAETNRLPFDMAESETDLVGGFHTEYGSFKFGFFFLSEYAHMFVGSAVFVLLFLGGWNFLPGLPYPWPAGILGALLSTGWFLGKTLFFIFFFVWVRWTLPRFRYDQVMYLGWKVLLPLSVANLFVYLTLIAFIERS